MKTIDKKIGLVQDRVARLKHISKDLSSFEAYQNSQDIKDITERNLHLSIEACLDIAKIIISLKELPEPKDNKGIFVTLAESKILSDESLRFLVPMAGTRNILVHGYDRVDDGLIYGILKRHLDDFDRYLAEIKENFINAENT
jgi:uncharacterized protein YutE (UPF0331/DUF86 family)